MKIRNIIAVGLSLFALASCSKDNQPVNVNLSVLIEKSVEKQRSLCFRDWGYE